MQEKNTEVANIAPKEKQRSFGNKMFDGVFYPLVQWVGVWGASIVIGNAAQNGNGLLNRMFNASVDSLTNKLGGFAEISQKLWNKGSAKDWAK
ncbi:MAG: hypothetical protein WCJ33_01635, partial [Pseudomonadota bacterium]